MALEQIDAKYTPELRSEVTRLLKEAEQAGQKVSVFESVVSLLEKQGLVWKAQIAPEFVGTHPQNRSEAMVSCTEAHQHGLEILKVGWSSRKCADATCVQAPPPPRYAMFDAVNKREVQLSDGKIPPLASLQYLSVGSSHTNVFLRSVKAGCVAAVDGLSQTADGRMSLDALSLSQPAFKDACLKGMTWTVLHHQIDLVWPTLVPVIQSALNISAQSGQGELEIMFEISRMRARALSQGLTPDFDAYVSSVRASLPVCGPYADLLAQFVKEQPPETLSELKVFVRTFNAGQSRACGAEFWLKLNNLKWGPAQKFPYVCLACVKAHVTSTRVQDGVSKLMQGSTMSALTTKVNRPIVEQAEELMTMARTFAHALGVSHGLVEAARARAIGRMDIRIALFLTKKQNTSPDNKTFDNLVQISEAMHVSCPFTHLHACVPCACGVP